MLILIAVLVRTENKNPRHPRYLRLKDIPSSLVARPS